MTKAATLCRGFRHLRYSAYFLGIGGGVGAVSDSGECRDCCVSGVSSGLCSAGVSLSDLLSASLSVCFCSICRAAKISSVRDTHGRFPKICSTSSVKITSRWIRVLASLWCPSECLRRISFARSYCSLMIRDTSASISLARSSLYGLENPYWVGNHL